MERIPARRHTKKALTDGKKKRGRTKRECLEAALDDVKKINENRGRILKQKHC